MQPYKRARQRSASWLTLSKSERLQDREAFGWVRTQPVRTWGSERGQGAFTAVYGFPAWILAMIWAARL